jgi:hypothetical protein
MSERAADTPMKTTDSAHTWLWRACKRSQRERDALMGVALA